MEKILGEFEQYCQSLDYKDAVKQAQRYKNAIKYLCDFLRAGTIDNDLVYNFKKLKPYLSNVSSSVEYKKILTFLEGRRQGSYLYDGSIHAALTPFFKFWQIRGDSEQNLSTEYTSAIYPDEDIDSGAKTKVDKKEHWEGLKKTVTVNAYERDNDARTKCIEIYGYNCAVCEMDFKNSFGKLGEKFIHIHHRKPISEVGEEYKVDPEKDLIPVCPNCHAMLHRRKPILTIAQLKDIIEKQKNDLK